jgi:hypothetical protein
MPFEFELLITGRKLSGMVQSSLVFLIARRTWGDAERPEYCQESLSGFGKLCGGVERKTIAVALQDLIRRKLVAVPHPERKGCQAGEKGMYKLTDPKTWRRIKPYEYEAPAALEDPDEDDEEDENAPELAAAAAPDTTEATVSPGHISRAQRVNVRVKGTTGPLAVVYYSTVDEPLAFRSRSTPAGRLQITVSRPAGCSRPQHHPFANHSPSLSDSKGTYDQYESTIKALCLETWGMAPDPALIAGVKKNAGAAPPELFDRIARQRLKRGRNTPGLLLNLAHDAQRTHLAADVHNDDEPTAPINSFEEFSGPLNPSHRWDRIRAALINRRMIAPVVYENWFQLTRELEETATTTTVLVGGATDEVLEFLRVEFTQLIEGVCKELNEPATIIWRRA